MGLDLETASRCPWWQRTAFGWISGAKCCGCLSFDARSVSPVWVHMVPPSVQLCLDSSSLLPSWHLCSHHPLCFQHLLRVKTCSKSNDIHSHWIPMSFIPSVSLWHREQILFRFSLVQEILSLNAHQKPFTLSMLLMQCRTWH